MADVLDMYVIYDHPLDWPNDFVVRRWRVVEGQSEPVPDVVPRLARSLEAARALVPRGRVRMPRSHPEEDPFIAETWL